MPAVPKPKHDRLKPKRGDMTKVSDKVRTKSIERSDGLCERCGAWAGKYNGECAHLIQAGQMGRGDQPWNIARLCYSCHRWLDGNRRSGGHAWAMTKRAELMERYNVRDCSLCGDETVLSDSSGAAICEYCADLYPERMPAKAYGRARAPT